jgi:hypothetical protein
LRFGDETRRYGIGFDVFEGSAKVVFIPYCPVIVFGLPKAACSLEEAISLLGRERLPAMDDFPKRLTL